MIFINMEVGHKHHSLSKLNADLFAVLSPIWYDMIDWEGKKGREKV